MALLDTWRNLAYQTEMDQKTANEFWGSYFTQEKAIYEQILSAPDTVVKGTVKELADGGAGAAKAVLPQPVLHRCYPRPQIVHRGRAAGCGEPDDVQCPAEPAVQRPVRIAERESAAGTDGGRITSQALCASSPTRRGLVYTFLLAYATI